MNRLDKWRRLPAARRHMALEAAVLLVGIRLGLGGLGFPTTQRILNRAARCFPGPTSPEAEFRDQVIWAVSKMGSILLGDRPCLTQALAVQFLLARRGYPVELCIGVAKGPSRQLVAHAWVESEGHVLIGGSRQELEKFVPLTRLNKSAG